jgi:hypothetical protein
MSMGDKDCNQMNVCGEDCNQMNMCGGIQMEQHG